MRRSYGARLTLIKLVNAFDRRVRRLASASEPGLTGQAGVAPQG